MSDRLLNAVLQMDELNTARMIEEIHETEITPGNYNNEQALRYTVITAFLSSVDDYMRFEELSGGKGYSDILFMPKKNSAKPALLIELKWNQSTDKALLQIKNRNYAHAVRKFEYTGELLLTGISYSTKTKKYACRIERVRV